MLKVGDTVKVIGTTLCGDVETECIKIGTICEVVDIDSDSSCGVLVGVVSKRDLPYKGYGEFWYHEEQVEKGYLKWVKS